MAQKRDKPPISNKKCSDDLQKTMLKSLPRKCGESSKPFATKH
jgi:hypothetical protein